MPKKIVISLYKADVIELIDSLPKGYRSLVIESALTDWIESEVGSLLIANLQGRKKRRLNKKSRKRKQSPKHKHRRQETLIDRLRGDFH